VVSVRTLSGLSGATVTITGHIHADTADWPPSRPTCARSMPLQCSCVERQSADTPDWQVAIIDGQPEIVLNRAAVEAPITHSPLGER
jgi:hypothetical protein